jgi:hypothetical protein
MNSIVRQFIDAVGAVFAERGRRRYTQAASTVDDAIDVDFEQAGHDFVLSRLNLNSVDVMNEHITPIWKNARTGAVLYVGNHYAAEDSAFLLNMGITSIVNCTRPGVNGKGELPNYHESSPYNFSYYSFPVRRGNHLHFY